MKPVLGRTARPAETAAVIVTDDKLLSCEATAQKLSGGLDLGLIPFGKSPKRRYHRR